MFNYFRLSITWHTNTKPEESLNLIIDGSESVEKFLRFDN
jgi:hypothetical protein